MRGRCTPATRSLASPAASRLRRPAPASLLLSFRLYAPAASPISNTTDSVRYGRRVVLSATKPFPSCTPAHLITCESCTMTTLWLAYVTFGSTNRAANRSASLVGCGPYPPASSMYIRGVRVGSLRFEQKHARTQRDREYTAASTMCFFVIGHTSRASCCVSRINSFTHLANAPVFRLLEKTTDGTRSWYECLNRA
eukprot:1685524-Rhodomonas_salina.3